MTLRLERLFPALSVALEFLLIAGIACVDLISDALPFGRLWYGELNAIDYAKFYSRSHDAVIRVYDEGWQCDRDAGARG
jgi:hypothetical protein